MVPHRGCVCQLDSVHCSPGRGPSRQCDENSHGFSLRIAASPRHSLLLATLCSLPVVTTILEVQHMLASVIVLGDCMATVIVATSKLLLFNQREEKSFCHTYIATCYKYFATSSPLALV